MKTIVFIGTNKSGSSYEAIKASEQLNYYTILLTDRKSFFDKRLNFPHVHSMRMCDLKDINSIRSVINRIAQSRLIICAIVSFIDPYCHTAAILSHELGLKSFSENAIRVMLDKTESRESIKKTPYSPPYHIIDETMPMISPNFNMPVVLKSPMSSASRDVHVASNKKQYQTAFAELRKRHPNRPILVEQYIPGPQFLVETITINSNVHILALVEQEIVFLDRFIVTGYQIITDENSAFFRHLKKAIQDIVLIHGMQNGPCHLELRQIKNEWKLIEVNPRISGGAMNLLIETAYGINVAKETLKAALGIEPNLKRKYKRDSFLQYIAVPIKGELIKITGQNRARNNPGIVHVHAKPKKGSILIPPVSMGHRYAYVIGTGRSAYDAKKNAKAGASEIKFHLQKDNTFAVNSTKTIKSLIEDTSYIGIDYFIDNVVEEQLSICTGTNKV